MQILESWKKVQYSGITLGARGQKEPKMATRLIPLELSSGPRELILFFPAAHGGNLSIKVLCLWKTCYQSATEPRKIGVLDPPPLDPPTSHARFASAAGNRSLIALAELTLCSPASWGPRAQAPGLCAFSAVLGSVL